jgi:hypothetical protein
MEPSHDGSHETSLEILASVRSICPVLREVFLPDKVWSEFQDWHRNPDNVAHHRSVILLALERGHLDRVTSAIHRYLTNAGSICSGVRQQYLKDLQERWMFQVDAIDRHQKFRIFLGRLTELQVAEWLEERAWVITGLEALREGADIEAKANTGAGSAFEVKFIGSEDKDFGMILQSLAGEPVAGPVSPYSAMNYLLFRVYEAAKQLARTTNGRIAVVVVEDLTWFRFDIQLKDGWTDWANPKFFNNDPAWQEFIEEQRHRFPNVPTDLSMTLAEVDAVWIVRQSYGYQFNLEYEMPIRSVRH